MATGNTPVASSLTMPSDEDMIAAAVEYNRNPTPIGGAFLTGFAFPPDNPVVYIKRQNARGEAEMQSFAYNQLQASEMRQNIRIPKLYKILDSRPPYLVMELIHGRTIEQILQTNEGQPDLALVDRLYGLAAKALSLFLNFSVPPGTAPSQGNDGQNPIRHCVYEDFQSYYKYTSVAVMDEHYNKLLAKTYPNRIIPQGKNRFEFAKEHTSCLYVIDFDMCSYLPLSFFAYALTKCNSFSRSLYERMESKEGLGDTTAVTLVGIIPGLIRIPGAVSPTPGVTTASCLM